MAATPRWYLSGGSANANPNLSLGGAKSSVEVSATKLNNLFDDTTADEALAGRTEYRLLYVENTGADDWIDPVMWISGPPYDPNPPYTPTGDTISVGIAHAGKSAVETAIALETDAPPDVSFDDPTTKGTGIALPSPDYATNAYVGIWIQRIVPAVQNYSAGTDFSITIEGEQA